MIKLYQTPSPIFFDPKGYRWKAFLIILLISSIFIGFVSFYIYKTKANISSIESDFKSLNYDPYQYDRNLPKKGLIAFLDNEYPSYYSLKENITRVAAVVVPWINFDSEGKIKLDSSDLKDLESDFVNKFRPGVNLFLQISDYNYLQQDKGKDSFVKFLNNYTDEDIKQISDYITNNGFKGIVFSFESEKWESSQIDKFLAFRDRLDQVVKKEKLVVLDTLNLNANDELIKKLEGKQNLFILNYWDNSTTTNTGLYDSRTQPEQLKKLIQKLNSNKYYINFPTYNKDVVFGSEGEVSYIQKKSFGDTVELIKKLKLTISTDSDNNSFVEYVDDEKKPHKIFLGDGVILFNQLFDLSKILKEDLYEGYAFSNIGFEDDTVWDVLKAESFNARLSVLEKKFKVDTLVENKGQGVLAKILSDFEYGVRKFKFSEGYISGQMWEKLPARSIVQRSGFKPKTLTLTFDDGPDPVYTPQILDILKKYDVKATFFVIGKNVKEYPEIAKRIVTEGHVIANHSYSHPRLNNLSSVTVDTEISGTDEILSQLVNVKTDFFRTPYNDIYGFNTENDLSILKELRKYNKFAVEDDVDTKDWLVKDPVAINTKTFDTLDKQSGSVLLLHDGGGDRTSTVKALPGMIEGIQKRGYAIENLSTNPDLNKNSNESAQNKQFEEQEFSLIVSRLLSNSLATIIIFATIIGVVKYILMFALYLYSIIKEKRSKKLASFTPKVSIIVPCYNEQKVICNTISSLLLSNYPDLEIVMVDDGSKDDSYNVVKKMFKKESRVSAYKKENGGKSSALNFGISVAKNEYVICVDADTVFAKDAVRKLMRHFKNENIGAVAGNVQIGNAINNLTKAQQLEYALSQNFEKQAFSSVNSVVVVPGPIGAWRKPVLLGAGGYHKDNLAEDTDLTLRVLQQGWGIHYESDAICITESPEDYKSFIKQRNRWQFGVLQVLFKNFELLFNANYGFIGMFTLPIILFQYILISFYPIMMVSIGWYLAGFIFDSYNGGFGLGFSFLWQNKLFLYFSAVYILLDAFRIVLAISKEKYVKNKYKMILIIPYYLFIFQNLMSLITFWTLVRAIRGKIATWGHLTRTGSVSLNQVQKQNN
jgi:peptidoglycan-N-acetylglucosamine deacetylase